MMNGHRLPATCSAVAVGAFAVICVAAGPVRLVAAAILLGAFVGAIWLLQRAQFAALGPAVGLALASLILIGLALAAAGLLDVDALAAAIGASTLAIAWLNTVWLGTAWAGPRHQATENDAAERTSWRKRPSPLAIGGAVLFAAAAACSVHYSADSATADSDQASTPALWAYPAAGRLDVGVWQPDDQGSASLRIVVTQAGTTIAFWPDVRLAPGQTWRARPVALRGDAPTQVVAYQGRTVVARLSG
jgi:hypothetical protein